MSEVALGHSLLYESVFYVLPAMTSEVLCFHLFHSSIFEVGELALLPSICNMMLLIHLAWGFYLFSAFY